ncbi:50S ribosomal protein L15 [Candidatus Uhrbacteria bacterium]|nr:50S ribosomal protein L15 [Candidatus Uhrbacteria bacterium]
MLSLHNLKPSSGAKRRMKRVGRGGGSGKGTTAGRGGKGQTARSGGRKKLKRLGMRHIILQTPKLRGFKSHKPKAVVVNLGDVENRFAAGERVNPETLARKGLVSAGSRKIKILGDGALKKKLSFTGVMVSESAKAKILAVGGDVK